MSCDHQGIFLMEETVTLHFEEQVEEKEDVSLMLE